MTKQCIERNDLPEQSELDLLIRKVGRQSPIAKQICTAICTDLKDSNRGVIEAWAAYSNKHISSEQKTDTENEHNTSEQKTDTENDVVFVLKTTDEEKLHISKYRTCVIHLDRISQEEENINQSIVNFERENKLPSEELDILIDFVKNISNNLMKKHSKVTMISASWCKHISSGKESAQLVLSPCVALYVPIKGYIPIHEDPFETKLGGYPVDVREGVFKPLSGANKCHRNLRMGCAITAGIVDEHGNVMGGTLGPFVKIAGNDLTYAITSAHVLLDHPNLRRVIEDKDVNFKSVRPDVYHPISEQPNAFGQLVFASYTPGENGKSGMEIAVIEMQPERCPIDGTFPEDSNYLEKGFDQNNPFVFNNGNYCDLRELHQSRLVFKYGWTTELTEGKVRVHGSTVRAGGLNDNILGSELTLYNQIEIESLTNQPFADNGDAGALVLTQSDEGLVAVGILEGKFQGSYIVTPIKSILDNLSGRIGQCQLLPFQQIPTVVYSRQQCAGSEGTQCASNANNSSIQRQLSALQQQMNHIETKLSTLLNIIQNRDG